MSHTLAVDLHCQKTSIPLDLVPESDEREKQARDLGTFRARRNALPSRTPPPKGTMQALTVHYDITSPLPADAPQPTLPSSTKTYPLSTSSPQSHLQSLEEALGRAREELNASLSLWKEAIGKAGLEKVLGRKKVGDEEEEGEEEEW